jgi:uncharacterized protein
MKCPICRKEVPVSSTWLPFCSERCKLVDLGNWASERYVISSPINTPEPEENGEADED